jgi:hypothetical protein
MFKPLALQMLLITGYPDSLYIYMIHHLPAGVVGGFGKLSFSIFKGNKDQKSKFLKNN